MEQLESFALK